MERYITTQTLEEMIHRLQTVGSNLDWYIPKEDDPEIRSELRKAVDGVNSAIFILKQFI